MDYIEVNSLTRQQIFKFTTNLLRENEKLEKNIFDFKYYIEFLENINKILSEEIASTRREYLKSDKCESCESLKNEVISLYETLEKLTKGKY